MATPLTAESLRVLKTAKRIMFTGGRARGEHGGIVCFPSSDDSNIRTVLNCFGEYFHNYSKENAFTNFVAYHHATQYAPDICAHIHGITRSLKVGDELTLYWIANNNTGDLADAGFARDELRLKVWRNGNWLAEHLLAVQVSPVASLGRMIQPR